MREIDPERWQQIKSILGEALAQTTSRRRDFVAAACGGDTLLRDDVYELLDSETPTADDLDQDAFSLLVDRPSGPDRFLGRRVGKFTIKEKIGVGGMGAVYLAERSDGEFIQRVAVKLIREGVHSEATLRRFLNERQILASLAHPNIAHLIDGGTTPEGIPFLIMEYVEGANLIEYADTGGLSLHERLDLFLEICAAVAFAHANLVIHRDLKPSNVIVSPDGTVKLLDFGIAKLLTGQAGDHTVTHQLALTPEYASPEQLRGETLTTATDIYSLGVILFELLTGSRPFSFRNKSIGEVISAATQSEPPRPSQVTPRSDRLAIAEHIAPSALSGDLDTVVLKALHKDPQRRYSTVAEFSEDLRRYLKGLPVTARKDTFGYRAKKFTQRNPLVVASAVAVALILTVGVAATLYLARVADKERQIAERRFNEVRTLANSFIFEINGTIDESPIKARQLLVTRAVEYLDSLSREAANDASLQAELAASYEKIAEVQAEHYGSGTGDTRGALENHRKALALREDLVRRDPSNVRYALAAIESRGDIADITGTLGDVQGGLALYREALTGLEALSGRSPDDPEIQRLLARAYGKVGQGVLRTGSFDEALANYERSIAITRKLIATRPDDGAARFRLNAYLQYAAFVLMNVGREAEAAEMTAEARTLSAARLSTDAYNNDFIRDDINVEMLHGIALSRLGRYSEGVQLLSDALERQDRISAIDPSNLGDVNGLADCHLELGMAMRDAGQLAKAKEHLEKAIGLYERVASTDDSNTSAKGQIAFTRHNLAETYLRMKDRARAAAAFRQGVADAERVLSLDPNNTQFLHDRAICQISLYELKAASRDELEKAIASLEKLHRQSPEHVARRTDLERARRLAA